MQKTASSVFCRAVNARNGDICGQQTLVGIPELKKSPSERGDCSSDLGNSMPGVLLMQKEKCTDGGGLKILVGYSVP